MEQTLERNLALIQVFTNLKLIIDLFPNIQNPKAPLRYSIAVTEDALEIEKTFADGGFTMDFCKRSRDCIKKIPVNQIQEIRFENMETE